MTMSAIPSSKQGAEDSGRYFRYMAEFVGFTSDDAALVARTKPHIEARLPEIVAEFYDHLLRYPPTRALFLKKDGTVDEAYVELRMRHLSNFWLRTASGVFGDDFARYVDYVGRAHTSRGADPKIYIAERYVIGQVGFISHAISRALEQELRPLGDDDFAHRALEAWDKLMMVVLEMLSRAYGDERVPETYEPLIPVQREAVEALAAHAVAHELEETSHPLQEVAVATESEIPEGERKIVEAAGRSIGVFHHRGGWYALRNTCLHRGGPVCTGVLEGEQLVCPWHGFRYDVTTGTLLEDPSAALETYPVSVRDGRVYVMLPGEEQHEPLPSLDGPVTVSIPSSLAPDQFVVADLSPGGTKLLKMGEEDVVVYNVGGTLYATQDACSHTGGPLSEGDLEGTTIICPVHGSRFDVTTGAVCRGPAKQPLRTYRVVVEGEVGRVVDR
jgi:nitrite reductase/ring-hydroxylating ferredoxin subunit